MSHKLGMSTVMVSGSVRVSAASGLLDDVHDLRGRALQHHPVQVLPLLQLLREALGAAGTTPLPNITLKSWKKS